MMSGAAVWVRSSHRPMVRPGRGSMPGSMRRLRTRVATRQSRLLSREPQPITGRLEGPVPRVPCCATSLNSGSNRLVPTPPSCPSCRPTPGPTPALSPAGASRLAPTPSLSFRATITVGIPTYYSPSIATGGRPIRLPVGKDLRAVNLPEQHQDTRRDKPSGTAEFPCANRIVIPNPVLRSSATRRPSVKWFLWQATSTARIFRW